MTAIGKDDRWHLEIKRRWVEQYNFYVQDSRWGQMFVRVCPYFPFSTRVCLNQHYWLALRLRERDIHFQQCANAFVQCSDPEALQKLADALTADEMSSCAQKWLTRFTPFFTSEERKHACIQHRLFFAQVEYCDNLLFRRRAAVDLPSSNDSWTPIALSVNPTNLPSSSVVASRGIMAANSRP